MTLAEEGNRLRLEIVRLGDAAKRQYPEELKTKVLDWVARSRQSGLTEGACAELLDMPRQRFVAWRSWRASVGKAPSRKFVPVEVREEVPKPFAAVSFVTPNGYRVEGLTIAEAIAILRAFS
jgi:hypothetical protein